MSDFKDLCEMYDIDPSEGHDLIDNLLEEEHRILKKQREKISLGIGRHVHIIWLTSGIPASVRKVELNTELRERVDFDGFNFLDSDLHRNPGSWFVRKGFIVRSKKVNGEWVQYAFSDEGPINLTRSEVIEYLNISHLEYDEYHISDFEVTKAAVKGNEI